MALSAPQGSLITGYPSGSFHRSYPTKAYGDAEDGPAADNATLGRILAGRTEQVVDPAAGSGSGRS